MYYYLLDRRIYTFYSLVILRLCLCCEEDEGFTGTVLEKVTGVEWEGRLGDSRGGEMREGGDW